jgi:hypothetical protein
LAFFRSIKITEERVEQGETSASLLKLSISANFSRDVRVRWYLVPPREGSKESLETNLVLVPFQFAIKSLEHDKPAISMSQRRLSSSAA